MLLFFLKWFNPIKYANLKSAKVFNVFTQTVNDLQIINTQVEVQKQKRLDAMIKAQTDYETLDKQLNENETVINNIQKFFGK
jgi:hypothetical protein